MSRRRNGWALATGADPREDAATAKPLPFAVHSTAKGRQDPAEIGAGSYGASTVKRRRRTTAQLTEIDDVIYAAVEAEHPVSLRGVFYRVVSAGAVDKTENDYRVVGRQLLKLRRAGVVPYWWITDGTRLLRKPRTHHGLEDALNDVSASYRRALWDRQPVEVVILSEKDAISGVILPVTAKWDVELGIVRGYSSETFAYTVAEDIAHASKPVYLYQLGDHDPSGVDAWHSFKCTVRGFDLGGEATFERLAVTPEQIAHLSLPTRPTKRDDPRAGRFLGGSVEVDAISPNTLRQIVEQAITRHIDQHELEITRAVEEQEREGLRSLAGRSFSDLTEQDDGPGKWSP